MRSRLWKSALCRPTRLHVYRALLAAGAALVWGLYSPSVLAQTAATWSATVGDFGVGANWSSGAAPGSLDTAIVNSGVAQIFSDTEIGALQMSTASLSNLRIENGAFLTIGSAAATTISGNSIVSILSGGIRGNMGVDSGGAVVVGNLSAGTVTGYGLTENLITVTGGNLTVAAGQAVFATLNNGSAVNSENGRIEIMTVNGGTFTNHGAGQLIPLPGGNLNAGVGVINQTGGTTNNNGRVTVGANVSGGVFNNLSTATVDAVILSGSGDFRNNAGATVLGAVTQSGGVFDNSGTVADATSLSGGTFTHRTGATIGGLTITGGTFQNLAGASIAGATQSSGSFINSGAVTGAFALAGGLLDNRASGTIGTLTVTGGTLISGSALSFDGGAMVADVTFAGDGAATQGAAFSAGDGRSLVKTGAGTLTLTAANAYTGGTRLEAGVLEVRHSDALGSGTVTILGGRLDLGDAVAVSNAFDLQDSTLRLGVAGGAAAVLSGIVGETGGSAGLEKTGAGTLVLGGQSAYTGLTDIIGGTLRIGIENALPSGTAVSITNGSRLDLAGFDQTIGSLGGSVGTTVTLGAGSLTTGGNDGSTTFAGVISGDGALEKRGAGTMILTGANTYTGGTTVTAGTLQVGDGGTSGALGSGNLVNNATVVFDRSDDLTVETSISGSGALVQAGTGTLILTGANTYEGTTTVSAAGALRNFGSIVGAVANDGIFENAVGASAGALTNNGIGANAGTLASLVNVSGSFANTGTITGAATISSGSVSIGGAAGVLMGNATITGGSLVFDRSDALTYGGLIANDGAVVNVGSNTTTLSGAITGSGTITQNNASGTLALSGDNRSYVGLVVVQNGTLDLQASNAAGDGRMLIRTEGSIVSYADGVVSLAPITVASMSTQLRVMAGSAIQAGVISEIGGPRPLEKIGAGTLILTGENTYSGLTTVTAGTLQLGDGATSGSIFGDVANAGSLVFNRSDVLGFGGAITGSGRLEQAGTGTTSLTGNSGSFRGETIVSRGRLVVNGILGGTLGVGTGGVLGGSGIVGATTISAGGVIAPGNSIGTLTVDGNLTFKAGSVYQVEVDPTGARSDRIVVNGIAFLAGSVLHVGEDGAYRPRSEYRILTASGGFAGTTFDGASSNYAFLEAQLTYSTTDVVLRLERNRDAFASVASTPNQGATAGGIESLGFDNPVHDAVLLLGAPGARRAFDQLSGEVHASGIAALIASSGNLRNVVLRRFQSPVMSGRARTSMPLASYASYGNPAQRHSGRAGGEALGYAAWGQAFGSLGLTRADGRAAGMRHDEGGFLAGIDAELAETWSVGAFTGYSRSTFTVRDRNAAGSSDNVHFGVHGGTQIGALRLNAGAAHTWHSLDTIRTVAFSSFADRLSASYDARTAQIFGEAGYRLGSGALAIEPFGGLAYVHATTARFSEAGGAAALTAASSNTAVTFSTLGLRAFSTFDLGGLKATARGMVGWRHALGGTTPKTGFNFAGGTDFSVSGAPIAKNAALVEAGLDLTIRENVTLGLSYGGQYSRRTREHGFNARLRVAF